MADTGAPRPAATILMLRDVEEGVEVLMLRRNLKSDFVGGAFVFPGGGVDADDEGSEASARTFGLSDEAASRRLGLRDGGLAYYVASVRELFEEAGLLLACDGLGQRLPTSATRARQWAQDRRALNSGELSFVDFLAREQSFVDGSALHYLAHWVTPIGPPRRYDTRFFVARAPFDQVAAHDEGETVAHQWLRPRAALDAHQRGEFEMIFPTIRTLETIADFATVDEVIGYAESLTTIPRVEPRLVERDGVIVPVLDSDEDPLS